MQHVGERESLPRPRAALGGSPKNLTRGFSLLLWAWSVPDRAAVGHDEHGAADTTPAPEPAPSQLRPAQGARRNHTGVWP